MRVIKAARGNRASFFTRRMSMRGRGRTGGARTRYQPEYELLDMGALDGDRYWITEVHYAKAGPDDLPTLGCGRD
ncbi:MAG: hypothetical protein ACRDNT_31575 [Streptosporangiaceae bacterium]